MGYINSTIDLILSSLYQRLGEPTKIRVYPERSPIYWGFFIWKKGGIGFDELENSICFRSRRIKVISG